MCCVHLSSQALIESDKTLAENIGRVKVRCLYHRSGCTWEGSLSDCTSHCSGCSFGDSPVVCNRCGVQIVHRQVHEHALSCPVSIFLTYVILIFLIVDGILVYVLSRAYILHN